MADSLGDGLRRPWPVRVSGYPGLILCWSWSFLEQTKHCWMLCLLLHPSHFPSLWVKSGVVRDTEGQQRKGKEGKKPRRCTKGGGVKWNQKTPRLSNSVFQP
jgi:hypothetical protein